MGSIGFSSLKRTGMRDIPAVGHSGSMLVISAQGLAMRLWVSEIDLAGITTTLGVIPLPWEDKRDGPNACKASNLYTVLCSFLTPVPFCG